MVMLGGLFVTFLMVAAALYGVLQLGLLSWPLRSAGWGVVLASFVVGVYGCGVAAVAAEYAAVRGYTAASGERTLDPAVDALSYTLVPAVEELAKIAPLLIAGISVKVRRQLGLSDYVVLGAGAGAGFGLLEVLLARVTDAQKAEVFPAGGWMIPGGISLDLTYVPDFSEVFTTWLPASIGTVSIGALTPELGTSLHLVWGALAGLGAGLLLRGPGAGVRLAGLIPLGLAIGHHALFNYSGYAARRDGDPPGWAADVLARLADVLGWLPVAALAVAMTLDYRQVRRRRRALPHTLLTAEHQGRTGTTALASFAACSLPWTATIAVRFARARRALYYASPPVPDPLHQAVAEVAQHINEANRDEAWNAGRVRAHLKTDPTRQAARRRQWLYLVPLLLALPAILALGAGSYPQTADLQTWFASGTGQALLLSCAAAGLAWLVLQAVLLLRARRAVGDMPQGEPLTLLRLRLYGTAGAIAVSALLLALRLKGYEADDRVVDPYVATLLLALMEALMWAGIALALASVLLFPPAGGALAFVTVGGAMRIGTVALSPGGRALLGSSAVALASAAGSGGGDLGDAPEPAQPGGRTSGDAASAESREALLQELRERGVRHNPDEIVRIGRAPDGRIVFLEEGNTRAGLQHVKSRHQQDFFNKGVSPEDIPDVIMQAVTSSDPPVGMQGRGRPIYEVNYKGRILKVAVTVGGNGFVVGSNPAS